MQSVCISLGIDSPAKVPLLDFRIGNCAKKSVTEGTYALAVLLDIFLRNLRDVQEGMVIRVLGYPVVRKKIFRFVGDEMKEIVRQFFKVEIFKERGAIISKSEIECAEALLKTVKGMKIETDIIGTKDVDGVFRRLEAIQSRSAYSRATFDDNQIIEFLKMSASLIERGIVNKPQWWSSVGEVIGAK
ncbi:MAG: hypothetical protein HGA61_04835 [Candidatus Moranbacteria bacterium]|nr:hypothetical protein [Candidatus Moranbacteria bacterium]